MRFLKRGLDRHRETNIYKPLRDRKKEIRILTILPGDGDPIKCVLTHVSLKKKPKYMYNALSYTWGDRTEERKIFLDDQPFQVTANLHAALERFRHTRNNIHLWVDAICVNQDDISERSQQVQLMRDTYTQATETWVWLGPDAKDSDRAIDLIELLSHIYDDCETRSRPRLNPKLWGSPKSWKVEGELVALENFLSRPWWYRVWIVQEVAVSSKVTLYCGQRSFSWYDLAGACIFLRSYGDDVGDIIHQHRVSNDIIRHEKGTISGGISRVISINNARVVTVDRGDSGLRTNAALRTMLYLLYSHRDADATDPRDKCFALVGLTREEIFKISNQAYARPLRDVYIPTIAIIASRQQDGALDFLDHAGRPYRPRETTDFPSWVPDWGFSGSRSSSLLIWEFERVGVGKVARFNACGLSTSAPSNASGHGLWNSARTRTFRLRKHDGSLLAAGIRFDVVDGVAPNYRSSIEDTPEHVSVHTDEYNFGVLQPEAEHSHYPTGEDIVDVLWKTLVLDRDKSSGRTAPWKWSNLFHLLFTGSEISRLPYGWDHQNWYLQINPFRICGRSIEDLVWTQAQAPNSVLCPTATDMETLENIYNSLWEAACGRRLSTTEKGYMCMGPADTRRGDIIAILFDCHVPVLLRQNGLYYEFVGTCYVHGIMQGEAWTLLNNGEYVAQDFDLR